MVRIRTAGSERNRNIAKWDPHHRQVAAEHLARRRVSSATASNEWRSLLATRLVITVPLTHLVNYIDKRLRTGRRDDGADGSDGKSDGKDGADDPNDDLAFAITQEAH